MNDDWSQFISVTIIMFLMIYLCVYLQDMALAKKDWADLKCNPLFMFINSITEDNRASIDNFKKCVSNV
jgi:hypothetical protein